MNKLIANKQKTLVPSIRVLNNQISILCLNEYINPIRIGLFWVSYIKPGGRRNPYYPKYLQICIALAVKLNPLMRNVQKWSDTFFFLGTATIEKIIFSRNILIMSETNCYRNDPHIMLIKVAKFQAVYLSC